MPALAYPKELTQTHWDKKKGIIAKTKPTGIGKALSSLQKMHNAVNWNDIKPTWTSGIPTVAMLKKNYENKKKALESTADPIEGAAKSVATLAKKWEGEFKKAKGIPDSAVKAAKEVADAATQYAKDISEVSNELANEMNMAKAGILSVVKSTLKPTLTNHLKKIDLFLQDIATFSSKASKENLQKLSAGDSGCRGFCTACTYWDEVMCDYPDIINGVFTGKAEDFRKPVNEFGAGRKFEDIESLVDKLAIEKQLTFEDSLEEFAKRFKKHESEVKKFRGYVAKAITKL